MTSRSSRTCPPHAALAAACGVSLSAVRQWSAGLTRAPLSAVLALADLTDAETAVAVARTWEARRRGRAAPSSRAE